MQRDLTQLIAQINALAEAQGVPLERIVLFGSRAKGSHRPDSDVDLVLVVPQWVPPAQRTSLRRYLYQHLEPDWHVDLLTATEADLSEMGPSWGLNAAIRDGKTLYRKTGVAYAV